MGSPAWWHRCRLNNNYEENLFDIKII